MRKLASAMGMIAVVTLLLVGCSATAQRASDAAGTPKSSPKPKTYPVPDGCPAAEDMVSAYFGKGYEKKYVLVDAKLLDGEVATPLLDGGCAYLGADAKTASNSSAQYNDVLVWYFNVGTPDRITSAQLDSWAQSAGGTKDPDSPNSYDLPGTFSGWSKAQVTQAGAGGSSFAWEGGVIPEFTQGAQGRVTFSINADKASAIRTASSSGGTVDPLTAMSQGLAAAVTGTANIKDEDGYTATITLDAKLQPFTSDVTKAPPGSFDAVGSSTVSGTAVNTTAGRETKAASFSAIALYAKGSAACTQMNGVSLKDHDWQDTAYCAINIGGAPPSSLEPGGRFQQEPVTTPITGGRFPESGDALAQLNKPVSFYLVFGGNQGMVSATWSADTGCNTNLGTSGTWVVPMTGMPDLICR